MSLPHRCAESDPGSRADADWCRSVHDLFKNTRSGWPTRSCTPVRSRKRGAPNFDSQLNTITPLLSLALIGSASGRFWGERDLESEAFSMRRLEEAAGVCGGRGALWDLNGSWSPNR